MTAHSRFSRWFGIASRALALSASALACERIASTESRAAAQPVKWRIIEPWLDPANGRGLFTHDGSVLTWEAMRRVSPKTMLGQYLEQVRRWGFNGLSLSETDLDANPSAVESVCRYLKTKGMVVFIHRDWKEPEKGSDYAGEMSEAGARASPWLNPYNAKVRAYWQKRIARDYALVPDLGGYRLVGGEYYYSNGAPWMGQGPEMAGKTGQECARDAIRMLALELGKHGGTLFWETCQDDPWGQRQEFWYFQGLTGEIPANAFILIKDCYWDFHPDWPIHPLDLALTKDGHGRSPYLTSIQLPGEYTGVNDFPWSRVDHISETMKNIVATGQQGIWVMQQPLSQPPWDHPLNLVNWRALSELMKNPGADPEELKTAWAKSEFGDAAAATVVEVLKKFTEAGKGIFEFEGLLNECHSQFPTLLYLDSHLCGPYRETTRMKGMIGWILPLDMYPPDFAARIRADPRTRLVFNQAPITVRLKSEAMAEKEGAVQRMHEAIDLWKTLRDKIAAPAYADILAGLQGNLNDAVVFRNMMDLYMDWKLGILTETKIDATLEACQGLEGRVVPHPLDSNPGMISRVTPATLKTFAEELRRQLRQPWIEEYWRSHPLGIVINEPNKQVDGKQR